VKGQIDNELQNNQRLRGDFSQKLDDVNTLQVPLNQFAPSTVNSSPSSNMSNIPSNNSSPDDKFNSRMNNNPNMMNGAPGNNMMNGAQGNNGPNGPQNQNQGLPQNKPQQNQNPQANITPQKTVTFNVPQGNSAPEHVRKVVSADATIKPQNNQGNGPTNGKQNGFDMDPFGNFQVKKGEVEFQENFDQMNVDFTKEFGNGEWVDFDNNFGDNKGDAGNVNNFSFSK